MLQWGRGRMAAEGRLGARRPRPRGSASMGPRPDGRGRLILRPGGRDAALLQWGRGRMAAEGPAAPHAAV